ncbi:hypothetical protein WICMUC_001866 [Wickerhamomyces mucosus]|uniref:Zn(2)-C6 fungal-type domain-containing protein n=1 Tax=Wickerhamomyces mucosus TaxID=1378264 RepID=A0A9P8PRV2_9ASCO|nr:hypothetical protein WICMUC_001866 [Wickerhamomyces mucosus]
MPVLSAASANNGTRKRISKACNYCRQRKIKCDGNPLGCQNCKNHSMGCVYSKTTRKKRSKVISKEKDKKLTVQDLEKRIDAMDDRFFQLNDKLNKIMKLLNNEQDKPPPLKESKEHDSKDPQLELSPFSSIAESEYSNPEISPVNSNEIEDKETYETYGSNSPSSTESHYSISERNSNNSLIFEMGNLQSNLFKAEPINNGDIYSMAEQFNIGNIQPHANGGVEYGLGLSFSEQYQGVNVINGG